MKIKIFFLLLICIFFGTLITKQNQLIKVPKEDRGLIQISEKIITGKVARVSDGDSFVLEDGSKIRLFAIDAPELEQTCILTTEILSDDQNKNLVKNSTQNSTQNTDQNLGQKVITKQEEIKCGEISKNKLSDLIANNEVICLVRGKDAYDRFVADCGIEKYNKRTKKNNKINVNKEMVLNGYAVAFQQISDKYLEDENRAKSENKGIWSMTFDMPSVYRRKNNK